MPSQLVPGRCPTPTGMGSALRSALGRRRRSRRTLQTGRLTTVVLGLVVDLCRSLAGLALAPPAVPLPCPMFSRRLPLADRHTLADRVVPVRVVLAEQADSPLSPVDPPQPRRGLPFVPQVEETSAGGADPVREPAVVQFEGVGGGLVGAHRCQRGQGLSVVVV